MIEIVLSTMAGAGAAFASEAAKKFYDQLKGALASKGIQTKTDELNNIQSTTKNPAILANKIEELSQNIKSQISFAEEVTITNQLLDEAQTATRHLRDERLRQAKSAFNAALILCVVGILIIFGGVALMIFRDGGMGAVITTAVGAVVEVVSALLFRLSSETQNRLDAMGRYLNSIETAQIAVRLIEKIEDPVKRDDAIRETAALLAGLGAAPPSRSTG